jgi:hypothetical protein
VYRTLATIGRALSPKIKRARRLGTADPFNPSFHFGSSFSEALTLREALKRAEKERRDKELFDRLFVLTDKNTPNKEEVEHVYNYLHAELELKHRGTRTA